MAISRRTVVTGVTAAGIVPVAANMSSAAAATPTNTPPINGAYNPAGAYLDYDSRSPIGSGSNVQFDAQGIIKVKLGSAFVYNPTTIAQYGLQQYGYYLTSGKQANLTAAVRQAGWLFTNQDRATGRWNYSYPFGVGGMSETLPAGWGSAMAQGQAISLLTRMARQYPKSPNYAAAATRALAPMTKTIANGGFVADFYGHPQYQEYPTVTAPTHALNGFQFCLVGLYDAQAYGIAAAKPLLSAGLTTLAFELPYHDCVVVSAYHLGHLTKPTRPVHEALHYHKIHVMLLNAINSFAPNPVYAFYANLWAPYPGAGVAGSPSLYSAQAAPLVGAGLDPGF
ncbi:D-glucuronyl C5-epimerase family protein [Rudaeicoccus suwonensis]|uniref:D-glucuronyl C5-epimerase-like protein n=1 Tax=Rudaeicoccus suwonensis TaxID=657409 RepID=A0A561E8S2_9MICO|nr:D-glucuronyl C5-epimerase family protein [Rudaeicoccus suwonensis]TWE12013.1 D-glucuronyl C5-epimerase-like protein [Rudaeicoccus suwonensis]